MFSPALVDQRGQEDDILRSNDKDQEDDDGDASDDDGSSQCSILSARSLDSELDDTSDFVNRNASDLDRLMYTFQVRDRILARIEKTMNRPTATATTTPKESASTKPSSCLQSSNREYIRMVRESEAIVRTQVLNALKKGGASELADKGNNATGAAAAADDDDNDNDGKDDDENDDDGPKTDSSNIGDMPPPTLQQSLSVRLLYRSFLFEWHHTVPAIAVVVVYCLAHLSFYEALNGVIVESMRSTTISVDTIYFTMGIMSCFILRITGGLWIWLNDDGFLATKFHLHNRLALGSTDARIQLWFKRHARIHLALNVLAVYVCFIALSHFQQQILKWTLDRQQELLGNLPSREYDGIVTRVRHKLDPYLYYNRMMESCVGLFGEDTSNSKDDGTDYSADKPGSNDEAISQTCSQYELTETLSSADEVYLYSQVSVTSYYGLMGFEGSVLVPPCGMLAFYTVWTFASCFALMRLGVRFM